MKAKNEVAADAAEIAIPPEVLARLERRVRDLLNDGIAGRAHLFIHVAPGQPLAFFTGVNEGKERG